MNRYLGFSLYVVALIGAIAIHEPAQAQTVPQWESANEACQGEPVLRSTGKTNPACRQRDGIAKALIKQGWLPANHGVWLSPAQQMWLGQVLNRIDAQARANLYAAHDSLMPMLLTELRRKLTDAQIFAVWNEQRPAIQAYAPFGAAIMTEMMRKLAMTYARTNDPRYQVAP